MRSVEKYFLRDASLYHVAMERASDGEVISILRCIIEQNSASDHALALASAPACSQQIEFAANASANSADAAASCCALRVVIDYMFTSETARGAGHAGRLLGWVREWCAAHNANLYVLALEDSCPFFLDRGFILETLPGVQRRLNGFTDTHLLRLAANRMPEPLFDDADADAGAEEEEDGGDMNAQRSASVASGGGSSALGGAESFIGDDAAVAAALASEFAAADLSDERGADADSEEDEEDQKDEDDERDDDAGDSDEDEEWSGDEEAGEDDELRRAIALSRAQQ